VAIEVPADQARVELPAIRVATRRIADGVARGDLGFTLFVGRSSRRRSAAGRPQGPRPCDRPGRRLRRGCGRSTRSSAVDDQDVRGANRSLYTTMTEVPAGTIVRLGLARGETVAITAGRRR
jgi:hypothetical protein